MRPWQFAVVGLALWAVTGCRIDPAIPILERQLRFQEDEIYRLRAALDDFYDCPSSGEDRPARSSSPSPTAERESDRSRQRAGGAGLNGAAPPLIQLPSQPTEEVPETLKPRRGSLPADIPAAPDHLQVPSESSGPAMDGPNLRRATGGVSLRPGNAMMAGQTASAVSFMPSGDSRRVAAIALSRTLTGGINAGDHSGDQGLLVVVEPRDAAGRTVDAPAEMSIVVLDPGLKDEEGMAARVARWDFTAGETAAMFRRSGATGAIHLMMTWPEEPPKHGKLHLFVRYVTADGRKLEANQPIEVALDDALGGGRTARPVWSPERR